MNQYLLSPLVNKMTKGIVNLQDLGLVQLSSHPHPLVNRIRLSFKATQRPRVASDELEKKEHNCLSRSYTNVSSQDFFDFKSLSLSLFIFFFLFFF